MFAENGTYLQEAELAEPDSSEAPYEGYGESEPYGEYNPYQQPYQQPYKPPYQQPSQQPYQQPYYSQPSYGVQMPQVSLPGITRTVWRPMEGRFVTYRWSLFMNRWVRVTPYGYGGGYPGS